MNWQDIIKIVSFSAFTSAVVTTTVIGALMWLARKIIERWFSKNLLQL